MSRLTPDTANPVRTVAEANAARNSWIAALETLPADHPAYIARLHLIRSQEPLRIAAIEATARG